MNKKILLKITTPQGIIVDEPVDIVTVRILTGYIGILYGHVPLVSTIVPSEMHYKIDNKEYRLNISGGILQVEKEQVKILADEVSMIK
ncbi:F0F1 ATP synthase subunit epsilon [Spiroplasma syrphidicola EA-1]|uniref:F0F1 ATP synthase subunit epsilon n=1 Tax=Spiroplasma syrphidicola EA-1 TaxID=1276229 RepID=R4U2V4_9MOLU|nr:F0F1 ATP synthase subunit epsilon [Spiroplasma syrphidicola]AGM25707.1 F0F1 ATP synthase subunit epsilon [Spiroplasma syrphidicola EA-1]